MNNIDKIVKIGDYLKEHKIDKDVVLAAIEQNDWFTQDSINYSLSAIIESFLNKEALETWLLGYSIKEMPNIKVGIIMAGNIPFVGFADLLAVLIVGAVPYIKPSSKDRVLMNHISDIFRKIGGFEIKELRNGDDIDMVIATGSDNTNRYFKANYADKPSLLRGSKASIAILCGNESDEELSLLWEDCFLYFGLGCRNVSHLFVPMNYDFGRLKKAFSLHNIDHISFKNSYLQNKAILNMTGAEVVDGGYFLLQNNSNLFAPIGVVNYSFYDNAQQIEVITSEQKEKIQCVVSHKHIKFGSAQKPQLWDYADDIDTIAFLQNFKQN